MSKLLIATNNRGKLREFKELLKGLPFELVGLAEVGITTVVEETGQTMRANARLKAKTLSARTGLLTLADDSGLEVDALGGAPGVLSSRYAGENATDAERVDYLLSKLKDVPWEKRTARFRCVIAITIPEGRVIFRSATCEGHIAFEPRGEHGFGYDPVFYFPRFGKTLAELPPEVKNRVSHRGKAARKARKVLEELAEHPTSLPIQYRVRGRL